MKRYLDQGFSRLLIAAGVCLCCSCSTNEELARVNVTFPGRVEDVPLPSEEEVQVFEQQIGHSLPVKFREYLLTVNGGYFRYCRIRMDGVSDVPTSDERLQCLRSLNKKVGSQSNLANSDVWLHLIADDGDILLRIGDTEKGGFIYVSLGGRFPADEILLKQPDKTPFGDDGDWYILGEDVYAFADRLTLDEDTETR